MTWLHGSSLGNVKSLVLECHRHHTLCRPELQKTIGLFVCGRCALHEHLADERRRVQVFMSMDVPSLTSAVMIHRLAPIIDTAAAAALFAYDPIRWWLSDSHAGSAVLLGVLYAMLVQLEVLARYPTSGPAATFKRRQNQRRVHALLLWLLHMNFVVALCSTYKCAQCPLLWLSLDLCMLALGCWHLTAELSLQDVYLCCLAGFISSGVPGFVHRMVACLCEP